MYAQIKVILNVIISTSLLFGVWLDEGSLTLQFTFCTLLGVSVHHDIH